MTNQNADKTTNYSVYQYDNLLLILCTVLIMYNLTSKREKFPQVKVQVYKFAHILIKMLTR